MDQVEEQICNWLAEILQRESCAHLTGTVLRIINNGVRGKLSCLDEIEEEVVSKLNELQWGTECPPRDFFLITYRTVAMSMTVARWQFLAHGGPNGLLVWPTMVERICSQLPARICHPVGGWVVLSLCMYNHTLSIQNHRGQASKFLGVFRTASALSPLCLRSEDMTMELYDAAFVMVRQMVLGDTGPDVSINSVSNEDSPEQMEAINTTIDDEFELP